MTDDDRRRTAYHESGHALPCSRPATCTGLDPRGQALGVTLATPETDRYNYARDELLGKIKVALADARRRRSRSGT